MKDFALFIMIVGMFFVIHAIYSEKLKVVQQKPEIKHKFLPRDVYYDQFFTNQYSAYNKAMFEEDWAPEQVTGIS